MPPKADNPAPHSQSPAADNSGKHVIIGIVGIALVAAAGSWLFRYNATHRAAKFWGPEAAALIRDAPEVTLFQKPMVPTDTLVTDFTNVAATQAAIQEHIDKSAIDISHAPGLVHLRNALLEDANFIWPGKNETWPNPADDIGYWWLNFHDPKTGKTAMMWFSQDCRQALRNSPRPDGTYKGTPISTEPIATGLVEIFTEMSERLADKSATPSPEAAAAAR